MVKKTKTVKDKIVEVELAHLATENYLEYAVASIGRMIPSSIDGLKPVQRRILYTMYVNKIFSFDKCLSIVGHTAQYITTGDTSVYSALVVLAQEGRYRYNTIVPQGNFGYVNSSSLNTYAASRYTEAKLSEYAKDFYFTEDLMYTQMSTTYKGGVEPIILPTLLPMGLVQGSNGIATGYSNYCLPHNLKDVAKCYIKFLDEIERNFSLKKMEEFIANNIRIDIPISKATLIRKSPRGLLDGIGQVAYKGRIKIEESSYRKKTILITDLPYLVQPVKVLDDIKEALNKNEDIKELISSIGDESSKDGIRVVIEVKKSATDKIQAIIEEDKKVEETKPVKKETEEINDTRYSISGAVSFYGKEEHGGPTASGETFNMWAMTCAHKSLPFGTKLKVTNTKTGKSVVVRVNDRGPFIKGRTVDLSYAAFVKIAPASQGVLKDSSVKIEVLR